MKRAVFFNLVLVSFLVCMLAVSQIAFAFETTGDPALFTTVKRGKNTYPQSASALPSVSKLSRRNLKPGALTVPFIPNNGQLNSRVGYYVRTLGGTVFVTRDGEIVYSLPGTIQAAAKADKSSSTLPKPAKPLLFKERMAGLTSVALAHGKPAETRVSIFHGNDSSSWQNDLPSYQEISLGYIVPGVEARLAARANSVEKLFYIDGGADPQQIKIEVSNNAKLKILPSGELEITIAEGSVRLSRPVAWQEIGENRHQVEVAYAVHDDEAAYGFDLANYDRNSPLVIDPLLRTTYLGGASNDEAHDIAIGPNGDIYVVGETSSDDFPKCSNTFCAYGADPDFGGSSEAFVARISADLTQLKQTTYLGGSGRESAEGLAIDGSGNVFVTGDTDSSNFPGKTGGADTVVSGRDGFVAKLTADLRTLTQSTYVGGSGSENPHAIAISKTGEILIGGTTSSSDLPSCQPSGCFPPGRPDIFSVGDTEGFLARFNASLTEMTASTYLGGSNRDEIYDLIVFPDGNTIYACGTTNSTDFPFISGGADITMQDHDGFVTRLSGSLGASGDDQSTYYGGSGYDECYGIVAGVDGQIYITGETSSTDLPSCQGINCPGHADDEVDAAGDAYVARLSTNLQNVYGSTYLGGTGFEMGNDIGVAPAPWNPWANLVYVTGETYSSDFPQSGNGDDSSLGGSSDGFVAYLDTSLSKIVQATYFGGSSSDFPTALTVSAAGDIFITGESRSDDLPGTQEGFNSELTGSTDAFVARFSNLKGDGSYYTIPVKNGKAVIIHLD